MGIVALLQTWWHAPRAKDVAVRVLLLMLFSALVAGAMNARPVVTAAITHWLLVMRGTVLMIIVYGIVFLMLASMFVPMLVGQRGWHKVSRGIGTGITRFFGWFGKIIIMGAINTFVLAIQLAYALVSPQNASDRVVDASTHYVERMADLIFKPMR